MQTDIHLWSYLAQFFLEWETFQTKVVEKIKRHILCSVCPPPENRAVYETMCTNTVEPDESQMTVWHMRTACWILKATDTHSEYVILPAFPLQQWLHGRAPTLQYSTVQYSTVQYSTVQYSIVQYNTVQYSTVQYSTVQYSTVQHSTVQYSTV